MSRTRMHIALLLALGLAVVGCAPASVEDDVASLNEKVDALTAKVDALQQRPAGGGSNTSLENEAKRVAGQIKALTAAGKIDEAKAMLQEAGQKYASTKMGAQINGLGKELAVFGKATPAKWGVERWIQGQDAVNLESGKTTLIVFWETWCPHCRNELPKLQEVYTSYQGKGLQMVGMTKMSRDTGEDAVRELLNANKISYPIAKEDGSIAAHFAVSGIPAAAVVKGGKVLWRGHPATITGEMLDGWLKS